VKVKSISWFISEPHFRLLLFRKQLFRNIWNH